MEEWLAENAVALASALLLGMPTLFFTWRAWLARRRIVAIEVRPPRVLHKGYGELKGNQLHLVAEFRVLRNEVYIHGTRLVVSNERLSGRNSSGHNKTERLKVGEAMTREWAGTDLRHLPTNKKWRVCWYDAEDRGGCEDVPNETARALVAYRMESERL